MELKYKKLYITRGESSIVITLNTSADYARMRQNLLEDFWFYVKTSTIFQLPRDVKVSLEFGCSWP
jgi:superfamily I DNA and RNA helicase